MTIFTALLCLVVLYLYERSNKTMNDILAKINTINTTVEGLTTTVAAIKPGQGTDLTPISSALDGLSANVSALSAAVNTASGAPVTPGP